MGQPIVVTEKPSATNPGVIRFETNRLLTGMDHERYREGEEIFGHRPPDELARRLLDTPAVAGLAVHGNMITVELHRGFDSGGLREVIEDLYIFYPEDGEPASDDQSEVEDGSAVEADDGSEADDEASSVDTDSTS